MILRSRLLDLPGVAHGFTTREGGVSRGGLASLNLGRRPDETDGALVENWSRVLAAVLPGAGLPDLALVSQVHGAGVVVTRGGSGPLATLGDADALVTDRPGLLLAVRVADCVPILVAGPRGVAAIHAGWRGVVAGVVPAAIQALSDLTGDAPEAMVAAIGPHISGAAFEVGDEVVAGLAGAGLNPNDFVVSSSEKPRVDLTAAVRAQLAACGVGAVDALGLCTVGDPRFFSHRRDGAGTGRMAAVVGLR